MYVTTLSDSDSSNSNFEESCDEEGNYSAFMTIAHVESMDHLSKLVEELVEHSDEESMGGVEESDDEKSEGLQENYNSLFEKLGEYAKVAKAAIKKMKKAKEDYRSLLV